MASSSSIGRQQLHNVLPDEDPDLRVEAGKFFDLPDVWLQQPSIRLGGLTPAEAVADGREEDVRDMLRLIKYVGMS